MTKTLDQLLFAYYNKNDGVRITDLHQGIVWGTQTEETRRDERLINRFDYDGDYGTVLNRFLMQAAIGYPLTVHGTGGQTRAFIHIQDTVRCIQLAIENPPQPGERVRILNQMTETHRVATSPRSSPRSPVRRSTWSTTRARRRRRTTSSSRTGAAQPRARPDHARGRAAHGGDGDRGPLSRSLRRRPDPEPVALGHAEAGRPGRCRPPTPCGGGGPQLRRGAPRPAGRPGRGGDPGADEAESIAAVLDADPGGVLRARGRRRSWSTTAATTPPARSPRRTARSWRVHAANRGQGAAFATAYALAREHGARFIVTLDADGQWDPADVPGVLAPVVAGEADFVLGSRVLGAAETDDNVRAAGVRVFAGWSACSPACGYRHVERAARDARRADRARDARRSRSIQSSELLIGAIAQATGSPSARCRCTPAPPARARRARTSSTALRYAR